MKTKRERWLREVRESQRNIVFPDTVANEGRFWRTLAGGSGRLTKLQLAGIAIVLIWTVVLVASLTLGNTTARSWRDNLISGVLAWVTSFGILGAFVLIFRIAQIPRRRRRPNGHDRIR